MRVILMTNLLAVSFRLFSCELPEVGDRPKRAEAR
jgi:hypothetical protein